MSHLPAAALDETVATLSRLIRFDTTNPPGNETPCALWIKEQMEQEGIACHFAESAPGRGNLVARVPAQGERGAGEEGAPLLLLSHIDVVPAVAAEWSRDPFGGEVKDGYVWGRGALDMKHIVAMWMQVMRQVRRSGLATKRDLIFAATADEEAGGHLGAGWLAEQHWDWIEAGAALNEGGGEGFYLGGVRYHTYQPAEKAGAPLRLRAKGTPGHASVPHDDNPIIHLARALAVIGDHHLPVHLTPTFAAFIRALAAGQPADTAALLERVLDPAQTDQAIAQLPVAPYMKHVLGAMVRNSLSPTQVQGGVKRNVIPAEAVCGIDCRLLPGQDATSVRREVEQLLAAHGLQDRVEVLQDNAGQPSESPLDAPLVAALRSAMGKHAPQAILVPWMMTAATDARFTRPRGVPTYGFAPLLPEEDVTRVHGIDERISLASLEFGLQTVWEAVHAYCT